MDIIHISVRTFHLSKGSFHINANRPWIDSIYVPMDDTADTNCTARIPSFMSSNVPALCTSRVNMDTW
jgi:hypothetical protein